MYSIKECEKLLRQTAVFGPQVHNRSPLVARQYRELIARSSDCVQCACSDNVTKLGEYFGLLLLEVGDDR